MSLKRFKNEDLLYNIVEASPKQSFYIYDGTIYESQIWPSSSLPNYSFITKDGNRSNLKTVSTSDYDSNFIYGDQVTGSSYMFVTSSLVRYHYDANGDHSVVSSSLRTTFDHYKVLSPHFEYSSSLGNKETQEITVIDIPSMYYGSRIERGTVDLKMFISGTLVGRLQDIHENGTLVQTEPLGSSESGSVAGVCLYREGFIALTGSWDLTAEQFDFENTGGSINGAWVNWGGGIESDFGSGVMPSSSFSMDFKGKTRIPTLTMFCHANAGEFNYSNNPTFIKYGQDLTPFSSSTSYREPSETEITNVVKTGYNDPTGSFEKTTFISYVKIYDEEQNLLGIAKVAKPVRKTEKRDYTFKLKIDL